MYATEEAGVLLAGKTIWFQESLKYLFNTQLLNTYQALVLGAGNRALDKRDSPLSMAVTL